MIIISLFSAAFAGFKFLKEEKLTYFILFLVGITAPIYFL